MNRKDGKMKGLPFYVNMVIGDRSFEVYAYYKPWTKSLTINHVEELALSAEEIDSVKNEKIEVEEAL